MLFSSRFSSHISHVKIKCDITADDKYQQMSRHELMLCASSSCQYWPTR